MLSKFKAVFSVIAAIVFIFATGGYTAEQIPEFTEATGWRKYVGYGMVFCALAYSCRKIWVDIRDRKKAP